MGIRLYRCCFKRIFDIMTSVCGILIAIPIFIVLLPLVSVSNRGPVFFTQERPGMHNRLFRLIKIKTMNEKRDGSGKLLPDKFRLTAVGRFIRSFSLDELPQLLNVLRGDMSLVGPRPLLTGYLTLYNTRQLRRHEVRPGITGWAQINGRNKLTWEEKFEMDVWYVENISFLLDIKILLLTLLKTIKREGINSSISTTMERFEGSRNNEL